MQRKEVNKQLCNVQSAQRSKDTLNQLPACMVLKKLFIIKRTAINQPRIFTNCRETLGLIRTEDSRNDENTHGYYTLRKDESPTNLRIYIWNTPPCFPLTFFLHFCLGFCLVSCFLASTFYDLFYLCFALTVD